MDFTRETIRRFARECEVDIPKELMEKLTELHMDSSRQFADERVEKAVTEYKSKAEAVQKELDELKKKVEADTKEREGKDYDKLKQEFDDYKAEQEKKATRTAKESAYKEILKDAGVTEKHWAKILKYSDVDALELDDKGKAKDSKSILKSIKEEWGDHIETTQTHGADIQNPPSNTGGSTKTKEEILNIKDYAAKQKAIAENHTLFGF